VSTITVNSVLETFQCPTCGGTYAIASAFVEEKRLRGGFWACPYSKRGLGYPPDGTELARLKRTLEYQEATAEKRATQLAYEKRLHDATRRTLSATRGVVTRIKNRIGHGVCPCCKRHFGNLQKHMDSKHPGYARS